MSPSLQAALLGTLQGLTEFLPVSSSGHLVLAQEWLGASFFADDAAVAFDLVLHLGTLLPVLWFYRAELGRIVRATLLSGPPTSSPIAWLRADADRWLGAMVVLATIPTGVIGLLGKDAFEALFHGVRPVGLALMVTGALLFATRWRSGGRVDAAAMGVGAALVVGIAQGLAITPGISRSGTTIAVALFLGLDRALAARFSFLLAIPAILGAAVLMAKDGVGFTALPAGPAIVGFVVSMIVGYGALTMLVALVRRGGIHRFAYYLWPVGFAAAVLGSA